MQNERLIEFRRKIHAHPELSNEEKETAAQVREFLRGCKPSRIIEPIGGTGVLAEFDSGKPGPSILFRAELDALPIQEESDLEYRSSKSHVSHMCGHDGHLTILLGVADYLVNHPLKSGKLSLLFQPGEENGTGAKAVINDEAHDIGDFDYVLALHNLPGYPKHEIVLKQKSFTAHVISLVVKMKGKTSHAAEPESGINPAYALPDIINICNLVTNNNPDRSDFFLVTPIHIDLGEKAYGISAGYGELHLTIRAWDQHNLKKKSMKLLKSIEERAESHGLTTEHEWIYEFFANMNNQEVVDALREVAEEKGFNITNRRYPFKWGEDFGLFTQKYKGAMFGLGSGEDHPALHNPDYDFPDEIIETGIQMFTGFMEKMMKRNV